MGILISQYKDPYKPTSIMESRRVFFIAQVCPIGKGITPIHSLVFSDGIGTLKKTTYSEYLVGYTPPKYIF